MKVCGGGLSYKMGTKGRASEDFIDAEAFTNSIGMRLMRIEPGTFQMGFGTTPLPDKIIAGKTHRRHGDFDEHPTHKVEIIKNFYMGACQVTNAQYEEYDPEHENLRGKLVYPFRKPFASEEAFVRGSVGSTYSVDDNEAVTYVSWHDAVGFCRWLSEKEGLPYRLPTEAEWEYACRAGTTGFYNTGDSPPKECLDKADGTSPLHLTVGEGQPNEWGLYDMHGNVEEWCFDWYGPYEAGKQVDSVGHSDGDFKVTRGGSHSTEIFYLRSANRMGTIPEDRHWLIGIRLVVGEMSMSLPLPHHPPSFGNGTLKRNQRLALVGSLIPANRISMDPGNTSKSPRVAMDPSSRNTTTTRQSRHVRTETCWQSGIPA